jgi:uncharacterized damage-inducible protein DinB
MKRTIVAATIALILPLASVAAQQAPQPSAPGTVITSAIHGFGMQYGAWLMTAFDSIPADKYGYKPTPKQMSIGEVAAHLEGANYLLCTKFSGTSHPMTARDSTPDSVKAMWPKDTLVARLKASFAFCHTALSAVTDAQLTDSMPGFGGRKMVRARLVDIFVLDLVDHYSQIAIYMRLNGMLPPSAYPRKPM